MMLCQPYSETCNCRKPLVNKKKKKALVTITLQYPSAALESGLSLKPLSKNMDSEGETWHMHKQTQEGSTEMAMDAFQDFCFQNTVAI